MRGRPLHCQAMSRAAATQPRTPLRRYEPRTRRSPAAAAGPRAAAAARRRARTCIRSFTHEKGCLSVAGELRSTTLQAALRTISHARDTVLPVGLAVSACRRPRRLACLRESSGREIPCAGGRRRIRSARRPPRDEDGSRISSGLDHDERLSGSIQKSARSQRAQAAGAFPRSLRLRSARCKTRRTRCPPADRRIVPSAPGARAIRPRSWGKATQAAAPSLWRALPGLATDASSPPR